MQAGVPCIRDSDWCGLCPWKLSLKFFSSPQNCEPQYLSLLGSSRVTRCSLLLKSKNPNVTFIYVKFPILQSQQSCVLLKKEKPGRLFTILHMILSTLPPSTFQTFSYVPSFSIHVQVVTIIWHEYRLSNPFRGDLRTPHGCPLSLHTLPCVSQI